MKKWIDTKSILKIVKTIEKKRGYVQNPEKIIRHMISKLGQIENALFQCEEYEKKFPPGMDKASRSRVASRCLEMVYLSVYLSDALRLDINSMILENLKYLQRRFGVRCGIK